MQVNACQPLGLAASFGFGDRTGLATPGHIAALAEAGDAICGIFAQQSIREMTRTGRSPEMVMADAMGAVDKARWTEPCGADADHLKTIDDVRRMFGAGFTFFTLDPSDFVNPAADALDGTALAAAYAEVAEFAPWDAKYAGREISLTGGLKIELTRQECLRAAVKYGRAVRQAILLAQEADAQSRQLSKPYEIELSIDETPHPTTAVEHCIIAAECLEHGMKLVSLAPRFVGDFEKGVDFKGDRAAFEQSLQMHAAIASTLGPYKLSLHSGSDKLSIYSLFAKATQGRFHVKTAGTSYLEALRVVVRRDVPLFKAIALFARERYSIDRATYHVSAELDDAPDPRELSALELEDAYLQLWSKTPEGQGFTRPGRQILHCTFGSVLTHAEFGPALKEVLRQHPADYAEVLREHFVRHLIPLTRI